MKCLETDLFKSPVLEVQKFTLKAMETIYS